MIKYTRILITFLFAAIAFKAGAQTSANTSSPYSQYGIGNISPNLMPQNAGMGGIGVATNTIGGFSTVNFVNPAAYATISLTTIDVGAFANVTSLSRTGLNSQSSKNFGLNHLAFAVPVSAKSALSFGLHPYSQVGYNFRQSKPNFGTSNPADTNAVNYLYSGEGGLTKAFIGYGFGIGKNLLIGANVSYIFGNIKNYRTTSVPDLYGAYNTRVEDGLSISGLNYDYGVQYMANFGQSDRLILGYSGSANTKLNAETNNYVSHYTLDADGNENIPLDSVVKTDVKGAKLQLPQINRFGISYKMGEKLLIGADYTIGNWADVTIAGNRVDEYKNSQTINVGAQITPNINALNNYWALVDYRFGIMYNKSNLRVAGTDINQYAATIGFGLPLRPGPTNTSFYKINISAEYGRRGALTNSLVRENYINIRLGFTLNDKWFQRYRFD